MDPSGFGQTPPPQPPAPPAWSQPDQPGQPSPYGQPAGTWAAPPPAAPKSRLPLIMAIVVAVVLIIGGGLVVSTLFKVPDAGKVVFSTDAPIADSKCKVEHQVTTIKVGTPVYATYIFSSKQGDDPVSITIAKDGSEYLAPTAFDVADTKGYDCYADTSDLSKIFEAGTYKITLTAGGKTVAEGTIVITP
jgi:hypothetical protein